MVNPLTGLIEGSIVHYVPHPRSAVGAPEPEHRAAIVVFVRRTLGRNPRPTGVVNLVLFLDGDSDAVIGPLVGHPSPTTEWKVSVAHDDGHAPGTWHWIEKA